MKTRRPISDATRAIHAGQAPQTLTARTVGPPIQRGSTIVVPDAASLYDDALTTYGLGGLVSHQTLLEALCALEGAAGGQLYPSGLAALTGPLMSLLKAGDEVLVVDSVYGPTRRFCDEVLARFGVTVRYYPARAEPPEVFAEAGPDLRLVLLESPGSLTFEFQDVPAIATIARARGAISLMDNTWAAGLLFKPLAHGVDISIQALTKYVCGHSDIMMGSALAKDPKLLKLLEDGVWDFGWSVAPDDAYHALRGLRTMPTRIARHDANGRKVAAWLRTQPEVLRVLHPAFEDSPDHALWKRDFEGACGLFGAVLRPAPERAVDALLDSLSLFKLGFSWGGFESLAISEGRQLRKRRFPARLPGPLIRLHVGLDDPDDLIADLRAGLDAFNAAQA